MLLLVPVQSDALQVHRVTRELLGRHVQAVAGAVARGVTTGWTPSVSAAPDDVSAEAILVRAGLWRPARVSTAGPGYWIDGFDLALTAMRLVNR